MKNRLFEVKIAEWVDPSELAGIVDGPNFLGIWEQDGLIRLYWKGPRKVAVAKVRAGLKQLGVALPDGSIGVVPVEDQDWNAKWAAAVQPIRVGRRFLIRPSWSTAEVPENGIEIVLDPNQAFGTGHHATTQLLLEWLEEFTWFSGDRVLDIGTGTGILSMGALRLGASFALGIDIDPLAIACAREYAVTNKFKEELELKELAITDIPGGEYAVLLANLDRKTILSLSPHFSRLRSAKSNLLLSGLLSEDEMDIRETFHQKGWTHQATRTRGDWIALHFGPSSIPTSSSG